MTERSEGEPVAEEPGRGGVSRREKRFEVFATALLAFSALATAWSSYQASLWDGIQSSNYTQASAARTEAAQEHTEANQYRLADQSVFENFNNASLTGDTEVATFYRARFSDRLEPAYQAWIALDPQANRDAPASPLAMPEYQPPSEEQARDLTEGPRRSPRQVKRRTATRTPTRLRPCSSRLRCSSPRSPSASTIDAPASPSSDSRASG